jgi:hypothetical protein
LRSAAPDRDLARGIAPWRSPAHAPRALQLTGRRRRESCAQGLARVLAETERPRAGTRISVVLPDPAAVLLTAPLIWRIVSQRWLPVVT